MMALEHRKRILPGKMLTHHRTINTKFYLTENNIRGKHNHTKHSENNHQVPRANEFSEDIGQHFGCLVCCLWDSGSLVYLMVHESHAQNSCVNLLLSPSERYISFVFFPLSIIVTVYLMSV